MRHSVTAALGSVLLLLLLPSCGATELRPAGGDALLKRYGITVEVPAGWEAAITHGALHAANFALPSTPGQPLADGQLFLQLFETDPGADSPPVERSLYPQLASVPALAAEDFNPPEPGTKQAASVARRTFSVSDRLFILFAESGTPTPPPAALAQLDKLLASILVEPGDFYPGSVDPPRFAPRDGWHVGDSGPRPVLADGNFVSAWASTIAFRDVWNAAHADKTLRALPPDGIVIWIGLTRTNRFAPRGRGVTPPLRLADFEPRAAWEGQVRDLPEYLLWARAEDAYEIDARVYFGRAIPTPAMEDAANTMLAGLRLPNWPSWD